jgi:hypothetical protein
MLSHSSHLPFLVSIDVGTADRREAVYDHRVHPYATFGNVNSEVRIEIDNGQRERPRVSIDTISDIIALAEADIAGRLP